MLCFRKLVGGEGCFVFFGIKVNEGYSAVEIDNKDISQQGLVSSADSFQRHRVFGNAYLLLNKIKTGRRVQASGKLDLQESGVEALGPAEGWRYYRDVGRVRYPIQFWSCCPVSKQTRSLQLV